MRSSTLLSWATVLIPILAQNISETPSVVQSPDFNLVIQSHNKTLDGQLLAPCHDGAAHEALCSVPSSFRQSAPNYITFQWNTTVYSCTDTNSSGTFNISCNFGGQTPNPIFTTGLVTWWLYFNGGSPAAGGPRVSQALVLDTILWSNVALAQISFADEYEETLHVAFDENGLMNIQQYTDDTLEPGNEYLNGTRSLYRWNICETYYTGYHYTALTWILGKHSAQNPTCQKVDVKRVFV